MGTGGDGYGTEKSMDVPGDGEKKPIWIPGCRWNIGNCTVNDSFAFFWKRFLSFYRNIPKMVLFNPYMFCYIPWNCTVRTDGTAWDAGCHDFLSYRR